MGPECRCEGVGQFAGQQRPVGASRRIRRARATGGGGRRGIGLKPRELQQLIDQMGRAVAGHEGGRQGLRALGLIGRTLGHLRLHADGRQRCAQFVRGVGGEALLGGEAFGHALEQAVERIDQRLHLARCVGHVQRVERVRLALRHLGTKPLQRLDRAAHGPHDAQRQQRKARQQRPDGARQARQQHVFARALALADEDGHVALAALGVEHMPVARADGLQAQAPRIQRRQRLHRRIARAHDQLPLVPDLNGHLRLVFVQQRRRGVAEAAQIVEVQAAEQGRGLREVGVEQFVHFMAQVQPGQAQHQHPARGQQAQHGRQQAGAQRVRAPRVRGAFARHGRAGIHTAAPPLSVRST